MDVTASSRWRWIAMSERYLRQRYLQCRILLVAAVLCLVAQGVLWLAGVTKGVGDPWVEWSSGIAALLFVITIYELVMPTLEAKAAINERRPLSPAEVQAYNKAFYTGVIGFTLGVTAFVVLMVRLVADGA
jgi:hypothetical protein